ncbi:PAS domain S-box protein, partial [bacterium]|nr:PAS domain S-box protein [bacterium]
MSVSGSFLMSNTPSHLNTSLQQMQVHDHVCFLFSEPEESFRVSLPFIQLGLERGDKCLYIADDCSCETFHHKMRAQNEQYEFYLANRALEIVPSHENYLKDGYFDSDGVISLLEQKANQAKQQGFTALRILGDAECLCGSKTPLESFIEYEAKVNILFPRHDILALCQYNRHKFPANILLDVIKTHPTVLVNSELCQNYYYIPPDEFPHRREADQELDWYLTIIRDQKRSTQSIKEKESQYRNLYNTMAQGVVYQEADGMISSMNPAAMDILGLTAEEMRNRASTSPEWNTIREDGSPFPGEEHPSMVAMRTGKRVDDVVMGVFNPRERGYRWIHVNAVPEFRVGEKVPYRVYATFSDITERKRAEEALMKSEERFRSFIENVNDIVYALSPDGLFTYVSPNWIDFMGEPAEKAIGKSFEPYVHPEDVNLCRAFFEKVISTGQKQSSVDYRVYHRDGSIHWHISSGSPMRDLDGTITGYVGLARDVTERKHMEEALRASEEKYRALVMQSADCLTLHDLEGRILDVNSCSCETYGYSRDEFLQMKISDLDPDYHERAEDGAFYERMRPGEAVLFEARQRTKTGREFPAEIRLSLVKIGGKTLIQALCRDISERKQAEEALRESERQKNVILNSTSEMVAYYDTDLHVIWANRASAES